MCLLVNLAVRFYWFGHFTNKLVRIVPVLRPFLKSTLSAIKILHIEARFMFGYPRFVGPVALIVARLARGRNALHNTPAVVCLAMFFLSECVEDGISTYDILPYAPRPRDISTYAKLNEEDPQQIYGGIGAASEPSKVGHRLSRVGDLQKSRKRQIALRLRCIRDLDFFVHGCAMAPAVIFTVTLLQLLLGASHLSYPFCAPFLKTSDISDRIVEVFAWEHPLACFNSSIAP
jgi:hypothetical protein